MVRQGKRDGPLVFEIPWDCADVFQRLYDWARDYAFDVEQENCLVCLTPGTHMV